jgi:hypothetical protein
MKSKKPHRALRDKDRLEPLCGRRRQHSTLGYATPMKFLDDRINTLHVQQLAA